MNYVKPLLITLSSIALAACSGSKNANPKLDYQSENNKIVSLEVPPDLNDPRGGNLYTLPDGTIARPDALKQDTAQQSRVLVKVDNMHIERQGNQRWLTIDKYSAAEVWPLLRAFWQEVGFTISSEEPAAGLMETGWAENRAKLPSQGLRRLFDTVGLGGLYSTSERDKFLIRVERNRNSGIDVFFTHKGLEEIHTGKNKDNTAWQARANDPNLEAAFLARFMQYLGADEAVAAQQAAAALKQEKGTKFAKLEENALLVYGSPERNVNRIGQALNRVGLTVQQYVDERGMFVVRPAPTESEALIEAAKEAEKSGFFGRLFGGKKKPAGNASEPKQQMFVFLEDAGNAQRVHLLNQLGQPYTGADAQKWLNLLYRELH